MSSENWIEEAKKQAKRLKTAQNVALAEKEKKEKEEREDSERELLDQLKNIFHQVTDKHRSEIDVVLQEATKQGLQVKLDKEEGVYKNPGKGNLITKELFSGSEYIGNERTDFWKYGVGWTITEPSTGKSFCIWLSVITKQAKTNNWIFGSSITKEQIPTITAKEVESQIKDWLFNLFSEQE